MTFLIADDVFYARKAVEKMIMEWDARSVILGSCGDGAEAEALMERNPPDVLVTDIRMPGADGLALAQLAQKRWPDMHIVLVTGYANFDYAREAIRRGVCGYLLKPLKKQELFEVLDGISGAAEREEDGRETLRRDEPPEALEGETSPKDMDVVEDLKAFLEENYYYELSLNELAAARYFLNPSYLSRLFKAKTGKTFSRYLMEVRMRKAQELLETGERSISEVSSLVGYTSPSNFIQNFKKVFGCTPGNAKVRKEESVQND